MSATPCDPAAPLIDIPASGGVPEAALQLLINAVPETISALIAIFAASAVTALLQRVRRAARRMEEPSDH